MDRLRWHFQKAESDSVEDSYVGEIDRIFRSGMNLPSGWNADSIRKALSHSTIVGLLNDDRGNAFGYAMYAVSESLFDGKSVLWEKAVCLVNDDIVRRKGYSSLALKDALGSFPEKRFGWLGGRTQNPLVLVRYSKLGRLFPFDIGYDTEMGQELLDFLCANVEDVRGTTSLDRTNGICRRVYDEGRLGDYPTDGVEGSQRFESQLAEWDFDRDSGDAIIVVSQFVR